ncbi:hypothetical protein PA6_033_00030 [Aquipseudomonas alcaligenes NBRC 14159]|uniref:Uncharacterized protein n=1 Tax=Aquipseudomonas alcaligenes (strain ATCC 14909 / DSM 50342 / CCUG 1425 / JCM 20561 / NBRC 14159 / NCIMB 9945 / NCTC 10367 / 1577) TaxID=1215092 RepID=U3BB80_AQUA1|nr:hypothetical protein PA6_033_00030 [Pseudomonas alcaligenes NBRC 14159]
MDGLNPLAILLLLLSLAHWIGQAATQLPNSIQPTIWLYEAADGARDGAARYRATTRAPAAA